MHRVDRDIVKPYTVLIAKRNYRAFGGGRDDILYHYIVNVLGLALDRVFIRFSRAVEARERYEIIARLTVKVAENDVVTARADVYTVLIDAIGLADYLKPRYQSLLDVMKVDSPPSLVEDRKIGDSETAKIMEADDVIHLYMRHTALAARRLRETVHPPP